MEYIKGLDGFRGFLVICIVVFHLFSIFFTHDKNYFPGGFLAVEAFFVLSGFLITNTLIKLFDIYEKPYVAFLHYLKRRFLRVFPALLITVSTTLALVLTVGTNTVNHIKEEFLSGLLFFYNFYLLFRDIPYFEKFEEVSFLLHLWSLSIEFQLYVILGLIFLTFYKLPKIFMAVVFISVIVLSVSVSYVYFNFMNYTVDKVYFSTEARSFGFFIGALVGLYSDKIKQKIGELTGYTLGLIVAIGLFLMFLTVETYTEWFYPFGFLLADVLTVLLIISFLNSDYIKTSFDTLDWIGKRSYSMYLWHFPVFIFVSLYYTPNPVFLVLALILLILLSDFSYLFIEQPFRRLNFKVDITLLLSYLVVLTVAFIPFLLLKPENLNQYTSQNIQTHDSFKVVEKTLEYHVDKNIEIFSSQTSNIQQEHVKETIFMIGDSVLLGAANHIKKILPNVKIDAKVGRQASEIPKLIDIYREEIEKSQAVLIHVGNNGYFRKDILEDIIRRIGSDKKIYLLTLNAAVPWKDSVNKNIYQMKNFPNVRIIEWDKYNQPDLFVKDKVHLSRKGIARYVSLIKSDIGLYPVNLDINNNQEIAVKPKKGILDDKQKSENQDGIREESYSSEYIIKTIDKSLNEGL